MTEEYVSHPTQWKLIAVAVAALLTAGIAGFQVMDRHIEALRKRVESLQIIVTALSVEMREKRITSERLQMGGSPQI